MVIGELGEDVALTGDFACEGVATVGWLPDVLGPAVVIGPEGLGTDGEALGEGADTVAGTAGFVACGTKELAEFSLGLASELGMAVAVGLKSGFEAVAVVAALVEGVAGLLSVGFASGFTALVVEGEVSEVKLALVEGLDAVVGFDAIVPVDGDAVLTVGCCETGNVVLRVAGFTSDFGTAETTGAVVGAAGDVADG